MKVLQLLAGLSTLTCVIVRPLRWLALIMVLLTFGIVILRYALNSGAVLLQESVMYLHGALFMLAIALGVDDNTHVRVDILIVGNRRLPDHFDGPLVRLVELHLARVGVRPRADRG